MGMDKTASHEMPSAIVLAPHGIYVPTRDLIIFINKSIIEHRKTHGQEDPFGVRDWAELDYLCYKLHNYRYRDGAYLANAIHVSSEILYYIACGHPFLEGNKTTAFSAAITMLEINLKMYAGPRLGKAYKLWKPSGNEAAAEGRTMEIIASWGEGSDRGPLKELLIQKGIIGKRAREPLEGDVKKFIKLFLREYIIE